MSWAPINLKSRPAAFEHHVVTRIHLELSEMLKPEMLNDSWQIDHCYSQLPQL